MSQVAWREVLSDINTDYRFNRGVSVLYLWVIFALSRISLPRASGIRPKCEQKRQQQQKVCFSVTFARLHFFKNSHKFSNMKPKHSLKNTTSFCTSDLRAVVTHVSTTQAGTNPEVIETTET